MSPRVRASRPSSGDHRRARDLSALAVDEPLHPAAAAWLTGHLAGCASCRAIAADYADQRRLLRSLRDIAPPPPRDLWARTAAAIEREAAPGRGRALRLAWPRRLPVAPIAGLLVVAIAIGAGLLNGVNLFPARESTTKGDGVPVPTPIAMTAGEVQFVTRAPDGSLELSTRRYAEVCPVGADACGTSAATDTTPLSANLGDMGSFDAVISPSQDHIVVMDKGSVNGGVYVVPVRPAATPIPDVTPTPVSTMTPLPATPTPTATPGPSATPAGPATPTATPATPSLIVTPTPTATASPATSAGASGSPSVTPSPPDVQSSPPEVSPSPEVAVTPAPDGTLEIASGVIVVGGASGYSADGSRFAFSARPVDGSTGPDVYVWQITDTVAHAVTTDHASLFSSWLGDQLLVSRVVDGSASTTLIDPATASEQPVPADGAWRPTVAPDGQSGVWWDGQLTPTEDGFSWTPGEGRLVLGSWPEGKDIQVLATGALTDWQVKWDESGTVLALWVSDGTTGQAGRLTLYAMHGQSGRVNLAKPLLADAPAFEGFSLRSGRLVWSAPVPGVGGADSEDTTVEVLAWSGDAIGHLALPTGRGVAVVR